ncbi:type VI secretion system baseplate subunit TssG [Ideonella sp. 4Y11]|uniref:Type VI secretion system baseplate subunit TssG n=1 Tax=Ideonella aquatica TaxID=2824119 RepID=A0A940YJB4_9BURK|nr:type VI secretion system baseplate subunit TssG [Ideonella aquatica]MBQ0961308.1 type VI secretion system baseplate subunit TssG [Ideonella aquatica]
MTGLPPALTARDRPARDLEAERAALWRDLAERPGHQDFFLTLRRIEALHPELPRLGEAMRPSDEPLRVGQPPELSFAPANVTGVVQTPRGRRWLMQRAFGLTGPNGALPIHLTEFARERSHQHGDQALARFLDHLTHRFALLFYRAWARAQPTVGFDHLGDSRYARWIGSLFGIGNETLLQRDAAGDMPKLLFAGRLARATRDADGLLNWLRAEFDVPVRVEQWCGHWMALGRDERSRLSRRHGQPLGGGAVLGGSVWDVQHKFRIVIGPLDLPRYHDFLPGGRDLARLHAMVRQWVGLEFDWDLRLVLRRQQVPRTRLGQRNTPLGRASWLGPYRRPGDAGDLLLDAERILRIRRPASASAASRAHPTPTPDTPEGTP